MKTISRKLFNEIVEARVGEIFELVIENIEGSGNEYQLPAGIVITGGTALLPGITNMAKKVFKVPARVGSPKGVEGLIDGISSPAYAASQGLVLYALHDEIYRGDSKFSPSHAVKSSPGIMSKISEFIRNLLP